MGHQWCKHTEIKTTGGRLPVHYETKRVVTVSSYLKAEGLKLCRKEEAEYIVEAFVADHSTAIKQHQRFFFAKSDWKANYFQRFDCILIDLKKRKYPRKFESKQIYKSLSAYLQYEKLTKCLKEDAEYILEVYKVDYKTGEKCYSAKFYVNYSHVLNNLKD